MANWQGAILTNKGRSLQAKVEGGLCQLALTKLKTGDGTLAPGQTLEALTDLVSPKQNIGISAIVVDEEGTEAAAVSVAGMEKAMAVAPGQRVDFHANRPFLYLITESSTGAILFAGKFTGK